VRKFSTLHSVTRFHEDAEKFVGRLLRFKGKISEQINGLLAT